MVLLEILIDVFAGTFLKVDWGEGVGFGEGGVGDAD
jgi:hypothetical protein